MTSAFFGKAQGALVVFDVSDKDSFNNVNGWIEEIEKVNIYCYDDLINFIICLFVAWHSLLLLVVPLLFVPTRWICPQRSGQ